MHYQISTKRELKTFLMAIHGQLPLQYRAWGMSGLHNTEFVASDSPNNSTQMAATTSHDLEGILTL